MEGSNYIIVKDWMFGCGLTSSQVIMLAAISGFCEATGQPFTGSINYLAKRFKLSEKTVRRDTSRLKEVGLITVEKFTQNGCTYNAYQVAVKKNNPPDKMSIGQNVPRSKCPLPPDKMSVIPGQNVRSPLDKMSTNIKEDSKEQNKIENKESRARKFCPPSVAEVQEYCEMRQNGIDAQRFCDFYSSKGWTVGKSKMQDWRAAVRTWESRERGKIDKPEQSQMPKADEPQYGICF